MTEKELRRALGALTARAYQEAYDLEYRAHQRRAANLAGWECKVDPEGVLSAKTRRKVAIAARAAHLQRARGVWLREVAEHRKTRERIAA